MRFTVACAVAVLFSLAFVVGARADAREDLAKEVLEEISTRQMKCSNDAYYDKNDCGENGTGNWCHRTMEAITDLKADLASKDTIKKGIYNWWKSVNNGSSKCMHALLGNATYCKTVNLAAKYDPHRNCPEAGRTNSTCWLNRSWERDPLLLPHEEGEWTRRCPVEEPKRMEFEDEE